MSYDPDRFETLPARERMRPRARDGRGCRYVTRGERRAAAMRGEAVR